MTPQNLQDYVKVYKNFIDEEFCKEILAVLKVADWQQHTFYQSKEREYVSFDDDLFVYSDNSQQSKSLNHKIWLSIERYILEDFKDFKEWFDGWNGHSHVRYNKYTPETCMHLHCDHIHSLFDGNKKGVPILSVLGSLNNDYEGGELIMFGDKKIELNAGDIMVFPSNFMYPHEVKKVTSGIRYSYVSWVW